MAGGRARGDRGRRPARVHHRPQADGLRRSCPPRLGPGRADAAQPALDRIHVPIYELKWIYARHTVLLVALASLPIMLAAAWAMTSRRLGIRGLWVGLAVISTVMLLQDYKSEAVGISSSRDN